MRCYRNIQSVLLSLMIVPRCFTFTLPNPPNSKTAVSSLHARSICTFDQEDFALKQGEWPYTEADLNRLDNSDDSNFYDTPRFVTHIDDNAIRYLTKYYEQEFKSIGDKKKLDVLDLCSSWISHLPETIEYGRVVGLGMNKKELEANKQLTEYVVQDLNVKPDLSRFEDDSFDVICNVVSVDYLQKPKEIFEEMHRILRPGGICLMSFSNRCFPTKAIAMWLQADDIGRLTIVASYFHYSANWKSIEAFDLKETLEMPKRPSAKDIMSNPSLGLAWMKTAGEVQKVNQGDPMFVVKGVK